MRKTAVLGVLVLGVCSGVLLSEPRQTGPRVGKRAGQPTETQAAAKAEVKEEAGRMWLGMVEHGGRLVPFALYADGKWTNPWPEPTDEKVPLPKELSGLPAEWTGGAALPRSWHVWWEDKAAAVARAIAPEHEDGGCPDSVGIRTSVAAEKPNEEEEFQRVGIASSVKLEIVAAEELEAPSEELGGVREALTRRFDTEEEKAVRLALAEPRRIVEGRVEGFGVPLAEAEREGVEIQVQSVQALDAGNGQRLVYVEAFRGYAKPKGWLDDQCEGRSWFSGWARVAGDGTVAWLSGQVELTNCEGMSVFRSRALGTFVWHGARYVVMDDLYYESWGYRLLKIWPRRVEVVVDRIVGGC